MRLTLKKIVLIILCLALSITLFSCKDKTPKITYEMLNAIEFKDQTFDYDGQSHSLEIDNPYIDEGVSITYNNNQGLFPGEYLVEAIIKYEDLVVEKSAKLTINKMTSLLEGKTTQEFYTGGEVVLEYQLNNNDQKVIILNEQGETIDPNTYKEPGIYNVEVYAEENSFYQESNRLNITLNIIQSYYNLKFESLETIADGTPKTLEVKGDYSKDYTIKYENNIATEKGKYYSKAFVVDYFGNIVETYCAVLTIDNPENTEFAEYLDEFLIKYIGDDQFSINAFFEKPENFGISKSDSIWYTYQEMSDEVQEALKNKYSEELKNLRNFKNAKLSKSQTIAYRNIENLLKYYIEMYSIKDFDLMSLTYINSSGGYVAQFESYAELYSLRNEEDIIDLIEYIKSTKNAFISYIDYIEDREEAGYEFSTYTIDNMKNYLSGIVSKSKNYYLTKALINKIDTLDFLTKETKSNYKNQITEAINGYYMVGVKDLYDYFEKYWFYFNYDVKYLAEYEYGKEIYVLELENILGYSNLDVEAYIRELDAAIFNNVGEVLKIQEELIKREDITSQAQFDALLRNNSIYKGNAHNIMDYLKSFSSTLAPKLKNEPQIVIKEMSDEIAKESSSIAFYLKSALDNTGKEYITVNSYVLEKTNNNEYLATLAHEGYPGHLYAYNYAKELDLSNYSTLVTNTAFAEGWATYVELKLYEYAKEQVNDVTFDMVMDYLYAEQLNSFLIEARIDVGIHYEKWSFEELAKYLQQAGYDYSNAVSIYYLMIEMPTQYSTYGYGKLLFYNLHEEAKKVLGEYYNELEFNTMILSEGWVELEILEELCDEYLKTKCYELGIEYK